MNKSITKEILEEHFRYFSFSLYHLKEKYIPLIFKSDEPIPEHVAYVCPICATNFILMRNDTVYSNTDFSLDHFPPESVGGSLKILTCRKCNNDAGRLFESELSEKMNYEATKNTNPNAHLKTKVKISGLVGNYSAFIKKETDGKFIIDFPTKAKQSAPFLQNWLDNKIMENDWEASLTIKRPDDYKILKSVLKTAYLICFINWGYDFIFSENGKLIRNVLNGSADYPTKTLSYWIEENSQGFNQIPKGLCLIEKPIEMQSYIVNIPLNIAGYSSIASVLIPLSDEEGWSKLRAIETFQENNMNIDITFTQIIAPVANYIFDSYTKNYR